jgi:hypothetical protein
MTCLRTSLLLLPQRGWKANSMLPWHLEVNIPMTHNTPLQRNPSLRTDNE